MSVKTSTPKHTCRTLEHWHSHAGLCLKSRQAGSEFLQILPGDFGRFCSNPRWHEGPHDHTIKLSPKLDIFKASFLVPFSVMFVAGVVVSQVALRALGIS